MAAASRALKNRDSLIRMIKTMWEDVPNSISVTKMCGLARSGLRSIVANGGSFTENHGGSE